MGDALVTERAKERRMEVLGFRLFRRKMSVEQVW